jgi:hypothetical protein
LSLYGTSEAFTESIEEIGWYPTCDLVDGDRCTLPPAEVYSLRNYVVKSVDVPDVPVRARREWYKKMSPPFVLLLCVMGVFSLASSGHLQRRGGQAKQQTGGRLSMSETEERKRLGLARLDAMSKHGAKKWQRQWLAVNSDPDNTTRENNQAANKAWAEHRRQQEARWRELMKR